MKSWFWYCWRCNYAFKLRKATKQYVEKCRELPYCPRCGQRTVKTITKERYLRVINPTVNI